jgi:hypothetical protein
MLLILSSTSKLRFLERTFLSVKQLNGSVVTRLPQRFSWWFSQDSQAGLACRLPPIKRTLNHRHSIGTKTICLLSPKILVILVDFEQYTNENGQNINK